MLEDFFEPFVMQIVTRTADGMGGYEDALTDGTSFNAGISTNTSNETDIALRNGLKTTHTLVYRHSATFHLYQHDIVKRTATGVKYRVTSNGTDMQTPAPAYEQYAQVTLEEFA